ncbi:MAG: hypothetical protein ABIF10_04470, partial [Candidatus Woesearchaeota archaeon]
MGNYSDLCKRYLMFTKEEITGVIVSILVLTMIVAFDDKSETFNISSWIGNFLVWLIIVASSFIVHQLGHRLIGLKIGYRVEYRIWWYGLLIGIVVMLLTRGKFWVLVPGSILVHHMQLHRLGKFRFGPNVFSFSMISLWGPLASIFFAAIVKTLQVWFGLAIFGEAFVDKLFMFNLWLAAYALLPIPPLAGSRIFFHSRAIYVFVAASVIAYAILISLGVFSFVFAVLIGLAVW